MRLAFKKLFESGPDSAKASQHSAIIQEAESKMSSAAEGDAFSQERDEDSALKYEKLSCNFDSIGQRSETLRAQLKINRIFVSRYRGNPNAISRRSHLD